MNARLLDPGVGLEINRGWLRIEGGIIQGLGDGDPPDLTPERLDCAGRTVIPGLIDCCFDVADERAGGWLEEEAGQRGPPSEVLPRLKAALSAGFTTVRMDHPAAWSIREAVEREAVVGPTVLAGGGGVQVPPSRFKADGNAGGRMRCGCLAHRPHRDGEAEDEVHLRSLVADRIAGGADHIVLDVRRHSDRRGNLSRLFDTALSEALDFGRLTIARVSSCAGLSVALEAGVRSIIIGGEIDRRAIQDAVDLGCILIPIRAFSTDERMQDAIALAVQSGAAVAFGSGSGGTVEDGAELWKRRDLQSPSDLISSATTVAARALRKEGRIGTLRASADADMLVLAGDPRTDPGVLGRGAPDVVVLRRGKTVDVAGG